jgi:hypothetical protein
MTVPLTNVITLMSLFHLASQFKLIDLYAVLVLDEYPGLAEAHGVRNVNYGKYSRVLRIYP